MKDDAKLCSGGDVSIGVCNIAVGFDVGFESVLGN